MLEKFLQKKYVVPAIILAIMIGAFAVRFYNYHDWLYFKMDQARDAFTISSAVDKGPGNLPLLGARAGATKVTYGFLHLGPIFYYFEYLSGVIFHSTSPDVFAYPDLFFGVMVLPLLYVFSRLYFKRYASLLVILMYAFSFIIIEYSRFAWNPNSLPFFTILSFLALIKMLNAKDDKWRLIWTALWSLGLTVGSQLHFVGFFCLIGISGLMIIYHFALWQKKNLAAIFKKEILKRVLAAAAAALFVFLVLYTPVIISDSRNNWDNSKDFVEALSSKQAKKPLLAKFQLSIEQQVENYTIIATGYIYPKSMTPAKSLPILFTLAVMLGGIYLAAKKLIRKKLEDPLKKDFLMLILLWVGVFFVLCIPLAYSIRPRFFIFTFAAPFLLLAFVFEWLEERKPQFYPFVIAVLALIVLGGNASGTHAWFQEQSLSQTKHLKVKRTLILKVKDGVTLGQLQRAADYIYAQRHGGNDVYFYVKPEHQRPLNYLLDQKKDKEFYYHDSINFNGDPHAQFFAVVPSDYTESDVLGKVKKPFILVSKEKFGQIAVWELAFPERVIKPNFKLKKSSSGGSDRLYWKDVF